MTFTKETHAQFSGISNLLLENQNISREANWAFVFNSTISSSEWLKSTSFSPGRWAVGYQYLYVMYRVLNEFRPESILELGLGQSTKLIAQYVQSHKGVVHKVVEHDLNWIRFFSANFRLPSSTQIINLPLTRVSYKGVDNIYSYKKFASTFQSGKFSFISIDGPFGFGAEGFARLDLLEILPQCLMDDFVVMIDDTQRSGETHMIEEMEAKLKENNIDYCKGYYQGEKQMTLICSSNLRFLTSM